MQVPMDVDLQHLRSWIGREESVEELASVGLARRYAATINHVGACEEDDPAPPLFQLCLCQTPAPNHALGEDGHPERGGFLPPVPLPRRMWAGGDYTFHGDIRLGELVRRRSTIRDVTLKEGKSGKLCFVTVDHEYTSNGRKVIDEVQNIVYREADSGQATPPPPVPLDAEKIVRWVTPAPTLLFRYSAVTFIGHRIHYDQPYTKEVEGYPGLVVHGPLQATFLLQLAIERMGSMPRSMRFKGLSPLFDTEDFAICCEPTELGLKLWTAGSSGRVAMEAYADR